jgi:hypothetical protein
VRKTHTFSPNHKVVAGPHNYSESHASAEPAGGGAQGPAPQMFSNGGKACYADGGDILGGGIRGKLADYGHALKDTYNQITTTAPKESLDANPVKDAQASAQRNRSKTIDDTVRSAETGE